MIKRVNVRTNTEIRNIETPVYSNKQNISMNTKDIRTCLMKGAYVYEILNDGSTLRLDLNNYNKENNVETKVVDFSKKEIPVVSNINNEEVPVVTESPIEPAPVVEEPVVEEVAPVEEVAEEPVVEEVAPVEEVAEEPVVEEAPVVEEPVVEEVAPVEEVAEEPKTYTNNKKKKNK